MDHTKLVGASLLSECNESTIGLRCINECKVRINCRSRCSVVGRNWGGGKEGDVWEDEQENSRRREFTKDDKRKVRRKETRLESTKWEERANG